MNPHLTETMVLPARDLSQVGEARRMAVAMAGRCDLDDTEAGRVAIIVTELVRNMVLHAGAGELILQACQGRLEILALDKGPGMADIDLCLRDGYSTAGTPGTGLGSVTRLSSFFEIDSRPGIGTAILARVQGAANPVAPESALAEFELGALSLPAPGETACGDAWGVRIKQRFLLATVIDGLGHGPLASEAAGEALRVFEDGVGLDLVAIMEAANSALRATRGAAMAVAEIDRELGRVRYAGVGNIAGVILSPDVKSRSMVSHNGTMGLGPRRIQEYFYDWHPASLLVLHSDGLGSHWSLERYPGLARRHPTLIAGVLWRDYARGRDDVTVLCLRQKQ